MTLREIDLDCLPAKKKKALVNVYMARTMRFNITVILHKNVCTKIKVSFNPIRRNFNPQTNRKRKCVFTYSTLPRAFVKFSFQFSRLCPRIYRFPPWIINYLRPCF